MPPAGWTSDSCPGRGQEAAAHEPGPAAPGRRAAPPGAAGPVTRTLPCRVPEKAAAGTVSSRIRPSAASTDGCSRSTDVARWKSIVRPGSVPGDVPAARAAAPCRESAGPVAGHGVERRPRLLAGRARRADLAVGADDPRRPAPSSPARPSCGPPNHRVAGPRSEPKNVATGRGRRPPSGPGLHARGRVVGWLRADLDEESALRGRSCGGGQSAMPCAASVPPSSSTGTTSDAQQPVAGRACARRGRRRASGDSCVAPPGSPDQPCWATAEPGSGWRRRVGVRPRSPTARCRARPCPSRG